MNLRKYLLPSGLSLLFGLSLALAQSVTKSVQLSQDPSGPIGFDTSNGVYFPGHILSSATGTPSITGTGTPTLVGTDTAGLITMGASATTATAVFAKAYQSVPWCVVTWQAPEGGTASPIGYTLATTSIALTQGATSTNKINYICMSVN